MAEDNEVRPVALAHATVLLRKLNEEAPDEGMSNPGERLFKIFESIDVTLLRLEMKFDEMFRQMALDRLDQLEALRELRTPRDTNEPRVQSAGTTGGDGLDLAFLLSGLGAVAATIGTTIGVISGQFQAFQAFFKTIFPKTSAAIGKAVTNFGKAVTSTVTVMKTELVKGLGTIGNFFKGIGTSIKAAIGENRVLSTIGTQVKAFFQPFARMGTILDDVSGKGGIVDDIIRRFSSITNMLKTFGQTIAKVASIVGKIFAPLAVILTLWDTVKGAFEGYEEGGFMGALQGAIEGFVTSLITKPLDLLKDAVSWISEKLGFENFAETLDSFSFTEIFEGMSEALFNMFGNVKDLASEAFKKFLRFVLPAPDSWAAKFVPDAVYEYANAPTPSEEKADKIEALNRERQLISPNEVSLREQDLQTKQPSPSTGADTMSVVSPEGTTAIVPLQQEEKKSWLSGLFSSDDEVSVAPTSTNQRMETAQSLAAQTATREEAKAMQSQQSLNVVNAPMTTNTNVSNQTALIETPSAVDGLALGY